VLGLLLQTAPNAKSSFPFLPSRFLSYLFRTLYCPSSFTDLNHLSFVEPVGQVNEGDSVIQLCGRSTFVDSPSLLLLLLLQLLWMEVSSLLLSCPAHYYDLKRTSMSFSLPPEATAVSLLKVDIAGPFPGGSERPSRRSGLASPARSL
jgi:hypothetical protein